MLRLIFPPESEVETASEESEEIDRDTTGWEEGSREYGVMERPNNTPWTEDICVSVQEPHKKSREGRGDVFAHPGWATA